jgi:hypothetical protein
MGTQVTMRLPEPSYADVNGDAIAWYSIGLILGLLGAIGTFPTFFEAFE